jgi:extradiol dioxygenase family protein
MGRVCVPHFGIHIEWNVYVRIKENIQKSVAFYDEPYVRFEGQDTQQETFFVEDPNRNVLEIKSLQGTYYKDR